MSELPSSHLYTVSALRDDGHAAIARRRHRKTPTAPATASTTTPTTTHTHHSIPLDDSGAGFAPSLSVRTSAASVVVGGDD